MNAVERWNFMAQALLHFNVEEDMETAGRAEHTSSLQTN